MISILIGLVVGLVLGLTGAGGSIFAVPLLMAVLGWPFTQAATASLLAVAVAATVGTALAWRHSYVRYRVSLLIALVGLMLSPVGIQVANALPESILKIAFALVLAIVAVRMYLVAVKSKEDTKVVRSAVSGEGNPSIGKVGRIDPTTGRLIWTRPVAIAVSCIGAVTGFLSGSLGVGGGFIIVPAIREILPLSMHSAVATSLMAIALTSSGTFIFALMQGRNVPSSVAYPFVIGTVIGMTLGRILAPKISGPTLQKAFALLATGIAIAMAIQATL
jgi:uncharacterized membrane protein YfcA